MKKIFNTVRQMRRTVTLSQIHFIPCIWGTELTWGGSNFQSLQTIRLILHALSAPDPARSLQRGIPSMPESKQCPLRPFYYLSTLIGLEVLKMVNMKCTLFLRVTMCDLVDVHRHFGGTYCFRLEGQKYYKEATTKKQAERFYRTTRRHIPK
jgi:hypothetical protein